MSTVDEIRELENQLIDAELGPDPAFFEKILADDALLDGERAKAKVVAAHRPGSDGPKFTRVEMSEMRIVDHGNAAVVTCKGTYEGPRWSGSLRFMRVWLKKGACWQVIAGSTQPVA